MTVQKNTQVGVSKNKEVIVVTWAAMATGDTGEPVSLAEYGDKTFQVTGTFGGASLNMEGSNDLVTWSPLSNRQGTAMAFTVAGMNTSQDRPAYVRPNCVGGAASGMIVTVCCHRSDIAQGG